jgi:hypothetical protein
MLMSGEDKANTTPAPSEIFAGPAGCTSANAALSSRAPDFVVCYKLVTQVSLVGRKYRLKQKAFYVPLLEALSSCEA